MKAKMLYCITHESMEPVEYGEITGLPIHLEYSYWCMGPFASCPPPEVEDWDVIFKDEQGIQDVLDYYLQEEMGIG
jgi:hypothetical protein